MSAEAVTDGDMSPKKYERLPKVQDSIRIARPLYDEILREAEERGTSKNAICEERLELGGQTAELLAKILKALNRIERKLGLDLTD